MFALLLTFALIPTAILYGLAFVIVIGACSLVLGVRKGALVGAFSILLVAIGIPLAANRATASELAMNPPGDRRPAERLKISGDVLVGGPAQVEKAEQGDSRSLCKEICSLLLATPGVRTVTVLDRDTAASFAVSANAGCAIDPLADFEDAGVLVWTKWRDCLEVVPIVRQHDYSVQVEGDHHLRSAVFPVPTLGVPQTRPMITTVRGKGGDTLLQVTQRRVSKIFLPLSFCWTLDLSRNKGFCASEVSDIPDERRLPHRLLLADFANVPDTRALPGRDGVREFMPVPR